VHRRNRITLASGGVAIVLTATVLLASPARAATTGAIGQTYQDVAYPAGTIQHVVWVQLENHTFDSVLGDFCAQVALGSIVRSGGDMRCNGLPLGTAVTMADGRTLHTTTQPDIVPDVTHEAQFQKRAWNNGLDDNWDTMAGCRATDTPAYGCMTQVAARQVPALTGLANQFAVADNARTFLGPVGMVPSSFDHLQTVTGGNLWGFNGSNSKQSATGSGGIATGCLSTVTTLWKSVLQVPMCFPAYGLPAADYTPSNPASNGGAPGATPPPSGLVVDPNALFKEAAAAGVSWVQYGSSSADWRSGKHNFGFYWNSCQYWASCILPAPLGATPADQFVVDATRGTLPSISWLTPEVAAGNNSEHNRASMAFGDSVLAKQMNALMHGPDWSSTAVFITYDDCGCFYDHVSPDRVPVVIVSPYAKAGFTDSTLGSFAGIDRFIEETFGLGCLWTDPSSSAAGDCQAYDWSGSFAAPTSSAPRTAAARSASTPLRLPVAVVPAASRHNVADVSSSIGGDES
jgi:phospholipase C